MNSSKPRGNIKTVLDLADRDAQDDFFTPLKSQETWFMRDKNYTIPFTPSIQTIPFRGPASFGTTIAVDLKSQEIGDLLHFVGIQIQLGSWLKSSDLLKFIAGEYTFNNSGEAWTWANAISNILIENAYLQIGDTILERTDTVGSSIFFSLFPNINEQFGIATDAQGRYSRLDYINPNRPFTTENGNILCLLPFWFSRTRYKESLPLVSCREGTVQLYITFRPFDQVVRQARGYRNSCTSTPLGKTIAVAQNPAVYNSLQSATLNTELYYSAVTNRYSIPLLSPTFMRQILPLTQPFTSLWIGLSSVDYKYTAYLELLIQAAFTISPAITAITFYLLEDPSKTFVFTLPEPIVNTKVASISFNNITIISTIPVLDMVIGNVSVMLEETVEITTTTIPPPFENIEIMAYSSLVDGKFRERLMRKPFEMLYREAQAFHFEEPLKYAITKPNNLTDSISVNLSLECNGPVEEIIWVIRRRGVAINNDWTNFGPLLESQEEDGRFTLPLLENASIWINGIPFIEQDGDWFRQHIARAHEGGIVAWNRYIYGYSFARHPGKHQPSGSVNMSRATSVQLRLTVRAPVPSTVEGDFDESVRSGWEVHAYCMGMNWLRFENGIANRIFSS
jgi:hypothetical protein